MVPVGAPLSGLAGAVAAVARFQFDQAVSPLLQPGKGRKCA
jgi:hypothetical protein